MHSRSRIAAQLNSRALGGAPSKAVPIEKLRLVLHYGRADISRISPARLRGTFVNDITNTAPDTVVRYVLDHYHHLMTPAEALAHRLLFFQTKAAHATSSAMRDFLFERMQTDDPAVHSLVAKGPDQFRRDVCERILRDHSNEVYLNRCPKCGALTRTPRARLCLTCGYTWHE